MLNRQAILPILLQAYRKTGRTEFRQEINRLLRDWILSNPYPARLNFSPQWRPLEVARRVLESWIAVFYARDCLDQDTRLLLLSSLLEHGDALRNHASFWGGNHLITEKLGLLAIALAFPEFSDSAGWKDYAMEKLSAEFLAQTYPDGSYKELSNHYQLVVLLSAQRFVRLMTVANPAFRKEPVYRRIEAMWDYFAGVMKPDGFGPLNNDSDLEPNDRYLASAWETFSRPDWLAMATGGEEGTLPSGPASRFYPWAGQAVLRNNWGAQADWIFFDAGPYGTAHQHDDRLHLSAYLQGRPVLTDSGRHAYQPGPWRDYFSGPSGHSTLLLDGRPADQGPRVARQPLPVEYADTSKCVFAAATASFSQPASRFGLPSLRPSVPWTRAVLYDKRYRLVLILDHLVSFQAHEIQANWLFHPDIPENSVGNYLHPGGPSTDWQVVALTGRTEPPLGGFMSPEYNLKRPATRLLHTTRVDRPVTLAWILQDPAGPPVEVEFLSPAGAPIARIRLLQEGRIIAEAELRLHPQPELIRYRHP